LGPWRPVAARGGPWRPLAALGGPWRPLNIISIYNFFYKDKYLSKIKKK